MSQTILLIDAYSQIYRAFFAIRSLTSPTGQPVNAIFGFTKMLKKLRADFPPTHLAVVFDLGAPQQRLAVLPSYKEQRPPTPPDLESQLSGIRAILDALGLPVVELDGEEADDIIATLADKAASDGAQVLIATNDKDFMQLVSPAIRLIRNEGEPVEADGVRQRYGVSPEKIVDLLSLTGDAVDNIPGVRGIGEKTAAVLLNQFGSLDNLLAQTARVTKPKLRAALEESGAKLCLNRQLITLNRNLPLPVTWRDLTVKPAANDQLADLYRQFGFRSLLAEVEKLPSAQGDLFG
jgi:DNA polymerase I